MKGGRLSNASAPSGLPLAHGPALAGDWAEVVQAEQPELCRTLHAGSLSDRAAHGGRRSNQIQIETTTALDRRYLKPLCKMPAAVGQRLDGSRVGSGITACGKSGRRSAGGCNRAELTTVAGLLQGHHDKSWILLRP